MYIVALPDGSEHYVTRDRVDITLCGRFVPSHTMAHAPVQGNHVTCCSCLRHVEDELHDTHPVTPVYNDEDTAQCRH